MQQIEIKIKVDISDLCFVKVPENEDLNFFYVFTSDKQRLILITIDCQALSFDLPTLPENYTWEIVGYMPNELIESLGIVENFMLRKIKI